MTIECCNFTLSLSDMVLNTFKKHIQYNFHLPESGGIITGKLYKDLVEILNCSEPTVSDTQSRYKFNRSYKTAQIFINEKFKKSKGEEIYLGEWHTHPEDNPIPSLIDVKSFEKTISKNKLNSNIHFMVIVGIKSIYFGIYDKQRLIEEKSFNV